MKILQSTETVIAIVLILVMLAIGLINPAFWGVGNLFSLAKSNVIIGIMALGVLLVMIAGGIDVSFPAIAAAALYVTVRTMVALDYDGVLLPFIGACAIGILLGAFNAFIVERFKMIPLIVTLGTASIIRGLVLGLLGTSIVNINKMPKGLMAFGSMNIATETAANGAILGLTGMILVYGGIAFIMHFVLKHSMIGRSIYAYGGDPEAARRAGVNTRGAIFFVYCTAGLLAGFAGLLHSSMIWQANPRDFMGLELDVLAAVVLGGASIFGGRGSVIGTMIGVFTLVMVKNSLILMKIDTTWQRVVVGAILILATAITAWRDRKKLV